MAVANGFGWTVLCPQPFEASWNGGPLRSDLTITPLSDNKAGLGASHFGRGVLTFYVDFIIRTESPYQLFVTGPLNTPKDGVSPLSAIVETSWLPFTFAMSYRFTRPDAVVRFDADEPVCQFFPLNAGTINEVMPECHDLASDPVLWKQFMEWKLSRDLSDGLGAKLSGEPMSAETDYQHFYHQGISPAGVQLAERPCPRFRVREFTDDSTEKPLRIPDGHAATAAGAERPVRE